MKILGIILIIIGFCITVVVKIGPSEETKWIFTYGDLLPMITALVLIVPGLIIYKKKQIKISCINSIKKKVIGIFSKTNLY